MSTNNLAQQTNKYALLIATIFFAITFGYIVFSHERTNLKLNVETENESVETKQVAEIKDNVQITEEDIIRKNKVIVEKIEIVKEDIPFETETVGEASRSTKSKILTEGKKGTKELTYKVRYEDNVEVSRSLIQEKITKQPVGKVIQYVNATTSSREGTTVERKDISVAPEDLKYTKVIDMKYTVYCLCVKCCGKTPGSKGYGITASGLKIIPGQNQKVVAIDKSVIKLGSKLYIQGMNGRIDYGYATAADTGSGIKGNRIDLYVDNHNNSPWGSTGNVKVYILE